MGNSADHQVASEDGDCFEFRAADGTVYKVRPLHPGDEDALMRLHGRLSERSIRMRFFTYVSKPPRRYLSFLTHVDGDRRFAYAVEDGDGEIVAVGRYEPVPDSSDEAEVALLVEDAHQRKGIGWMLLHRLADRARKRGIRRFRAVMLPENYEMIELLQKSKFPQSMRFDAGLVVSTFPLS
jgi:GNAT superfamily N-acetyltransferase